VSGCDAGPVFFCETTQQAMFAQQLLLQASWLGAFERMHDAAGSRSGVINIASASARKIAAVFRINSWVAQRTPRVEPRLDWIAGSP